MKKQVIVLMMSIVMLVGSVGGFSAFAVETETIATETKADEVVEELSVPEEEIQTEEVSEADNEPEISNEDSAGEDENEITDENSGNSLTEDGYIEEAPAADVDDGTEEFLNMEDAADNTTDVTAVEPVSEEEAIVEEVFEQEESNDAAMAFASGNGSEADPYQVKTAAQLDAVRNYEGCYFIQTANIDLAGIEWKPISGNSKYSSFQYNGNGYEITNLTIKKYGGDQNPYSNGIIGLFASVSGLENVKVRNAEINLSFNSETGLNYVGIIAGRGGAKNCSAEGSITVSTSGGASCFIGGVIGGCFTDIQNCHSDVDITCTNGGDYCYVGGVCGYSSEGNFTKLYSKGSIKVYGESKAGVGGIVGLVEYFNCNISKCVNYGEMSSSNTSGESYISGIIGHAKYNCSIENCVNFGNIIGNNKNTASGIALLNSDYECVIENCYNLGNLEGNSYSGRIFASNITPYDAHSNYSFGEATVNGEVPDGGLLPSGFNGMNMSVADLKVSVTDILDECGCEWPDALFDNNYFVIGRDSNSFSHDDSAFGTTNIGEGRIGTAYPTSLFYFNKLVQGLSFSEEVELLDAMNTENGWGGSCEGLSISLGMAYLNKIDISKFEGAPTCFNEIMPPCVDLSFRDLINYYQLLQSAKKNNNPRKKICNLGYGLGFLDGTWTWYSGKNEFWQSFIEDVKEANSKRTPLLFSMGYSSSVNSKRVGHSILTCGYKETNQYSIIQFYDCNCLSYGQKYLYLFIDKSNYDFWFSTSGDSIVSFNYYASNNNWNNFEYFGIDSWNSIDNNIALNKTSFSASNSDLGMKSSDSYMYFTVPAGDEFKLENTTGQYLEYNNNSFTGTLDIYEFEIIGDSLKYRFKIANDENYYVTNFNDSTKFCFRTDDDYISAQVDGADRISLNNGNTLLLDGGSLSYSVRMSSNTEIGLIELLGDASNSATIKHDNEQIVIESETPNDVEVNTYSIDGNVSSTSIDGDDTIIINENHLNNEIITSGSCGENLTYKVSGTGNDLTLTISGEGEMYDFAHFNISVPTAYSTGELPPWVSDAEIRKRINHIIVEEGVTGIGSGAFSYVGSAEFGTKARIKEISLPLSLQRIGGYAFYYTGCDEITIGSNNHPVTFEWTEMKTGQLLKGFGLARSNFRQVNICLGDDSRNSFKNSTVKNIVFLKGTKNIPASCFDQCEELQSVKIASSVTTINDYAFSNCHNLTGIDIPKDCILESIGIYAFENCNNLHTITLSENLSLIDQCAFENCTSLESIAIPDRVKTINNGAFNGCTSLRTIRLSEGIKSIPFGLFKDCENLESVTIPDSVTSISSAAFENCKKLTTILIPENVDSLCVVNDNIGGHRSAFGGAENLVEIKTDPNNTTYKSYDGCLYNSDLTELLYCPEGKDSIIISPFTTLFTGCPFVCGDDGEGSSKLKKLYFGTCCPNLSENVFARPSVKATAYYNNFLGNWPSEKLQNYGGEITWVEKALNLSECDITISPTSYTYDGTAKKPKVSLEFGGKDLLNKTDYTVSYKNNINAGNASVVINGIGNFTATVTKTFTIKKIANSITAKSIVKSYSAQVQTFDLGVKVKNGTPTYKSDNSAVTVNKAGKVTVKAKFIGNANISIKSPASTNYTSVTKTIVVKVMPTKTKFTSATNVATRKMALKWVKRSNATGYIIQYSTSSTFASAKTVRIDKYTTVTTTIGNLVKGKKYYVRIKTYKTVSGTKYYSGWSDVMSVMIKK